jgi:hypothetical protein
VTLVPDVFVFPLAGDSTKGNQTRREWLLNSLTPIRLARLMPILQGYKPLNFKVFRVTGRLLRPLMQGAKNRQKAETSKNKGFSTIYSSKIGISRA